jgi:hypothetical protein
MCAVSPVVHASNISSGQQNRTFSVFLWLWTIVIVINVCNYGEHCETPCIILLTIFCCCYWLLWCVILHVSPLWSWGLQHLSSVKNHIHLVARVIDEKLKSMIPHPSPHAIFFLHSGCLRGPSCFPFVTEMLFGLSQETYLGNTSKETIEC